jgi:hypothetical protein
VKKKLMKDALDVLLEFAESYPLPSVEEIFEKEGDFN